MLALFTVYLGIAGAVCDTNSCTDRSSGAGITDCVNTKTDADCSKYLWDDCGMNYATKGMGCAKFCIESYPQLTRTCSNAQCSDWSWPDCDGSAAPTVTTPLPDGEKKTLPNGVVASAKCVAKPGLLDSPLSANAQHCTKHQTNEEKCKSFQQFCDWKLHFEGMDDTDDKRMSETDLFGEAPDVLSPLYSARFGIFPPKEADGWWFSTDKAGNIASTRKSKWVFWHHDVETEPPFAHLGCDCYEDAYVSEDVRKEENGYYLYNTDCSALCSKNASGTTDKIYALTTVHDRVCHREWEVDGVTWDPSPSMNYWNPLNKEHPDSLGKDGLNMQRGENGSSWYWWGHSKPSWNANDQTSNVHVGELQFDSEIECRNYAQNYWLTQGYNIEFKSICSQFSSKKPCTKESGEVEISNYTCRAACDKNDKSYDDYFKSNGLILEDGSSTDKLVAWFHENCEYTPYQPMNDHVWPNFYVPESNQCFSQWQIGYEDQGCDACMHPEYDNTPDFDNGWTYGPVEGSSVEKSKYGKGNCAAQCGKVIMDGPGKPRDVKTAQECQQLCQEDSECYAFQWRPIPDWNLAPDLAPIGWGGNHINQVRSCLLKNKAQFDGALAARWDETGRWVYDAQQDYASYANIYQNLDCWPNLSGANWCLKCEETTDSGKKQTLYHSFKWRNNMISGPKYCDVPQLVHGSTDRLPSRFWDSENNPQVVPKCPDYPGKGTLKGKSPTMTRHNADGTLADQTCEPKKGLLELEGGVEWAQHCESAARVKNEESCDKFQQYCDWHIYYRQSGKKYKAFEETDIFGPKKQVDISTYSSTFNISPPVQRADGSFANSLAPREEKWVFWHYEASGDQSTAICDCLEPGCNDSICDDIANKADTKIMVTLPDKVCHLESDINGLLFDPNPTLEYGIWEKEWTNGLGMAPGESGNSWYWYGASKPSWNEYDQTAFVKEGEILFDTEDQCREHAVQYWADLGFNNFLSACEMFASKTVGVSNIDCIYSCDGRNNKDKDWFKANCIYADYHATSDNAWPNVVVADSNPCYAQWQIGYDDQACDICLDDEYDNSPTYDNGWNYSTKPNDGSDCNAKCGKIIVDAPGSFKDVKTAQQCQAYCQSDPRCVAFQWRSTPDWTAASSGANRINKVRACILKDVAMVEGALFARWGTDATWVGGSDPDWHVGLPGDVIYNQYSQGFRAMKDSQFGEEALGWYLMCTTEGDGKPTAHSWKWRNGIVSGPKYCDSAHTMKIGHGKVREKSRTYTPDANNGPKACPTPAQYTYTEADVAPVPSIVQPTKVPDFQGSAEYVGTTSTTTTTTPPASVSGCCDISLDCSGAWDDACKNARVAALGCAKSCSERVWDANKDNCKYYMDKFCAQGDQYCADKCASGVSGPSTSTTSTTACPNDWSGSIAGCAHTTSTTTTTTTTTTEWVPFHGSGSHDPLPTDATAPWPLPNNNGSVYIPTYIKERDGIISAPGANVSISADIAPASYCAEGTPSVKAGNYTQDNYFKAMGLMKLHCAGYNEDIHNGQIHTDPNCEDGHFDKYSFENFAMAAGAFPDFMTTHGKEKQAAGGNDLKVIQTALAGFLGNAFTETRGGVSPGQGFCFFTEQNPRSYGCAQKVGSNDYIGRGAFQLTHCENYQASSEMLHKIGVVTDFYNHPETVLDRWFPFGTAVAFWMSPQKDNAKPSMDYVSSYWVFDKFEDLPMDNASRVADVGYAVNIINGGIECTQSHVAPEIRGRMVATFLDLIGFQGTKDTIQLYGCQTAMTGENIFKFFYMSDGTYEAADTLYGK